jgi:hypothetical protein
MPFNSASYQNSLMISTMLHLSVPVGSDSRRINFRKPSVIYVID